MRRLWTLPPLDHHAKYQDPDYQPADCYVSRKIDDIEYVPLVSDKLHLRAELEILFFSSSMPANTQQIPEKPDIEVDNRVFCLLENDRFVVNLSVANDRLLTIPNGSKDVLAIIKVRSVAFEVRLSNLGIAM